MLGPSLVQIVATLVVAALLGGAISLLPMKNEDVKRALGSITLIVAALFLAWRFLLPGFQ